MTNEYSYIHANLVLSFVLTHFVIFYSTHSLFHLHFHFIIEYLNIRAMMDHGHQHVQMKNSIIKLYTQLVLRDSTHIGQTSNHRHPHYQQNLHHPQQHQLQQPIIHSGNMNG
jgi:hypothetical protein